MVTKDVIQALETIAEMNLGKRSPLEIITTILDLATTPQRKTNIMYNTGLTHPQMKKYLDHLLSKELIGEFDSTDGRPQPDYETTQKGRECLETFKQLAAYFTAENQE
jgi:predicted transcriptional regulator